MGKAFLVTSGLALIAAFAFAPAQPEQGKQITIKVETADGWDCKAVGAYIPPGAQATDVAPFLILSDGKSRILVVPGTGLLLLPADDGLPPGAHRVLPQVQPEGEDEPKKTSLIVEPGFEGIRISDIFPDWFDPNDPESVRRFSNENHYPKGPAE